MGSRDINALVACANIGSSSQPLLSRRESRRSVGDQCDVIPNPSAAASQNVALYRRLGGMSDEEVFEPTSLVIVSVAMRRTGESLVRPIASIGCCVSPQPVGKSLKTRRFRGRFVVRVWREISFVEAAEGKLQRKIEGGGRDVMT